MHLFIIFLAVNLLPIFLTAQTARLKQKTKIKYGVDKTRSFLCDKNLFLSKIIINTLDYITFPDRLKYLHDFDGELEPKYSTPIKTWPLPTSHQTRPWISGYQTSYLIVLDGRFHKFLSVVYTEGKKNEQGKTIYHHCRQANAGGKITSVTVPDGGFRCTDLIITSADAIKYAKDAREKLQDRKSPMGKTFPIFYEGNLEFSGQRPHTIWPISSYKKIFLNTATRFLVLDANFRVVDALVMINEEYEKCRQVKRNTFQISMLVPPIKVQSDEIDAFQCGNKYISTRRVLEDAKAAITAFTKQTNKPQLLYPKPFCELDLNSEYCGTVQYLWPVKTLRRITQSNRVVIPRPAEPFLAVLNRYADVVKVVAEETKGRYINCQRVAIKKMIYRLEDPL